MHCAGGLLPLLRFFLLGRYYFTLLCCFVGVCTALLGYCHVAAALFFGLFLFYVALLLCWGVHCSVCLLPLPGGGVRDGSLHAPFEAGSGGRLQLSCRDFGKGLPRDCVCFFCIVVRYRYYKE